MGKLKRGLIRTLVAVTLVLSLMAGAAAAASNRDELFSTIEAVFDLVESYHKDGADLETFIEGAIQGGLEALGDPYTKYFNPEDFDAFLESLNGTFSGIGAYLEEDGNYVIVSAPIKDSPAYRAGLQTGDRFLEANGIPLVGESVEKAQAVIRGEPGTEVRLKMERPSENRTFEVTIIREVITIPDVEYEMLENNVGYLALMGFSNTAPREFYEAVEALKEQGAVGLVLDLRQNPGGYVDPAVSIASAWVPKGEPVMYEVGKDGETVHKSQGRLIDMPTVVLVDSGTASAAEILAGAIQDYEAGVLVGTQTFGKGTVQQILFLSGGRGMKITIAEYLTAKRRPVEDVGLTPDYMVEPFQLAPELAKPMEFTRVLYSGRVGLDVLDLQNRLQFVGYAPETDGVMGPHTVRAVELFRRAEGLPITSFVDQHFVEALNERVAEVAREKAEADPQLQKAIELLLANANN